MQSEISAGDALHERALVLLAHDHMVRAEDFRRDLAGGVTAKVVQATVSGRAFADNRAEFERSLYSTEGYMRDGMEAYDEIFATVETMPDEVFVVRRAADIAEAKRTGRLGLILGAEGAKLLEGAWRRCESSTAWVCGTCSCTGRLATRWGRRSRTSMSRA